MANFTPQEIEEMLQAFFDTVGKRQYVGARYVPVFGHGGGSDINWNNSGAYEPLSIVYYMGDTYTSRQYVPAGVDISDTDYWVITGRYNAQVEQYRQEVLSFDSRINANAQAIADEATARENADNNLVDQFLDDFIPWPDGTTYPKYGNDGQVLSTLTNGAVKWEDPVVVTSDIAEPIIKDWLDDHPEATTTVEDDSVTDAKLVQSGGILSTVNDLIANAEIFVRNKTISGSPRWIDLFDPSQVSAGDVLYYSMHIVGNDNRAFFIDIYDANNQQLLAVGKTASGSAQTICNGSFIMPANAAHVYVGRADDSMTVIVDFVARKKQLIDAVNIGQSILTPTGDSTDRAYEISNLLATTGRCYLTNGEYVLDAAIQIPENGILCGAGSGTIIKLTSPGTNKVYINLTNNCTIKNLTLKGTLTARPDTLPPIYAIKSTQVDSQNRIEDVDFYGFNGYAIYTVDTYDSAHRCLRIKNCNFEYCGIAAYLGRRSEAVDMESCNIIACNMGIYTVGGNTRISNCLIRGCVYGLRMVSTSTSDNDGHSTYNGLVLIHNTHAFDSDKIEYGSIFNGCTIFYGDISFNNSNGIMFNGCLLGSITSIAAANSPGTRFSNCVFISTSASDVSGVALNDCTNLDGTPFTI